MRTAERRAAHQRYSGRYTGHHLARVAFPLGGLGAGMVCLEGNGCLGSVSVRHNPEMFHEPMIFAAVAVKETPDGGSRAKLLEGPVPPWKLSFPWGKGFASSGCGLAGKTYGLPRFRNASFEGRFPFATVTLDDPAFPLAVELAGWSPFIPGDADRSGLPAAALEYTLRNTSGRPIEAVYSFHSKNFLDDHRLHSLPKEERPDRGVRRSDQGFVLFQGEAANKPWTRGSFLIATDAPGAKVNCRWFRGGWFDGPTVVWKSITELTLLEADAYTSGDPSAGGSLYVPIQLGPGESTTIRIRLAWYVPQSDIRCGLGEEEQAARDAAKARGLPPPPCTIEGYRPWYASRFDSVEAVDRYFAQHYDNLRTESAAFRDCLFDTTLPPEVVDAVTANLSILKSPTVLRQADGRLWLWEGSRDEDGSCHGSCTHVWNYAHAIAHLFPALERSLRETEFLMNQDDRGHQNFRATLPIRKNSNTWHAAADGQLGGIVKIFREWRVSADTAWLQSLWPKVKQSLDFCIREWDPDHEGWLKEPHHNTYDIEFWGPDGMCTSFYAAALRAAVWMAQALGDTKAAETYDTLYRKARQKMETELYDGEYFIQKIRWNDLHAPSPVKQDVAQWNINYSEEAKALVEKEGPKYQYGIGCLSDGIIGAWLAEACGVGGDVIDTGKVASHLRAVHKYNFRRDLSDHANFQRPSYAVGDEGGLLLCSWPKGGRLTLPFVYSDEVWTGIEYQVASHLMMCGQVEAGLEIVRAARNRYDGTVRNPYSEYECGYFYGRALASYALLQGLTGQRYDAVTKTLHLKPQIKGDWRSFLCTASGYGTIVFKDGQASVEVKRGRIDIERIQIDT